MIDYRNHYGAIETNGLEPGEMDAVHAAMHAGGNRTVDWTDRELAKITRLRLLTDPGFPFWDVSYCWGELRDGTVVRVRVPFFQLPKRTWKAAILEYAKQEGVYAKRLGLFDPLVVSTLV